MSYSSAQHKWNTVTLAIGFGFIVIISACNRVETSDNNTSKEETSFTSTQVKGKWTTDFKTAEELKVMRNTIENFTLLNKKKFENLKAYQEFGDLLAMHVNRINEYGGLDNNSKKLLQSKLEKLNETVTILHGGSTEKSKIAVAQVNTILAEIDSTFTYSN